MVVLEILMWFSISVFCIIFLLPFIVRKYMWYKTYRAVKKINKKIKKSPELYPKIGDDMQKLEDGLKDMYKQEKL